MTKGAFWNSLLVVAALVSIQPSAGSAETIAAAYDPALAAVFAAKSLPASPHSGIRLAATSCTRCFLTSTYTSTTATGSGSSCTSAQSNLNSQLQSIANQKCQSQQDDGACNLQVHNTTSCTLVSGTYRIQGYATFSCADFVC